MLRSAIYQYQNPFISISRSLIIQRTTAALKTDCKNVQATNLNLCWKSDSLIYYMPDRNTSWNKLEKRNSYFLDCWSKKLILYTFSHHNIFFRSKNFQHIFYNWFISRKTKQYWVFYQSKYFCCNKSELSQQPNVLLSQLNNFLSVDSSNKIFREII